MNHPPTMLPALVLDIETVRRFPIGEDEDPEKFPPPPVWRIVTAAMCWLGRDKANRPAAHIVSEWGDEGALLRRIIRATSHAQSPTLVTWNGRRFDLPVIEAALLVTRTPWPALRGRRDMLVRWSCEAHVDLCDKLALDGAAPNAKLGVWGKCTGLGGKLEDGANVGAMFEAGEHERIARYCAGDVRLTAALYVRWLLTRGDLSDEDEAAWQSAIAEVAPTCRAVATMPAAATGEQAA